jgi:phosphate/sulfate permease
MPLEVIIALIFILPIVAFITAFVWYVNLGAWFAVKKRGRKGHTTPGTDHLGTEKA